MVESQEEGVEVKETVCVPPLSQVRGKVTSSSQILQGKVTSVWEASYCHVWLERYLLLEDYGYQWEREGYGRCVPVLETSSLKVTSQCL